jgi:fructokinase
MVVVAGEALFDLFVAAQTRDGLTLDARLGGSPYNVAVGLARLAQPVVFLGAIGRGPLGDRLLRALTAEGVDTRCIQRVAAPTTLGLVGLDDAGVPEYAFYGEGGADRQLRPEALAQWPAAASALHVGSFATVVEPIASTLRTLIAREHALRVIAYDPNVRLNVEPDLARWRAQVEWMLPNTHILKISAEDCDLLFPNQAAADLASRWRSAGVAVVVQTRGGDGADGWCAGGHVFVPSVPVKVVDTVGAGDTFQAALITWLAEHDQLSPRAPKTATSSNACEISGAHGIRGRRDRHQA